MGCLWEHLVLMSRGGRGHSTLSFLHRSLSPRLSQLNWICSADIKTYIRHSCKHAVTAQNNQHVPKPFHHRDTFLTQNKLNKRKKQYKARVHHHDDWIIPACWGEKRSYDTSILARYQHSEFETSLGIYDSLFGEEFRAAFINSSMWTVGPERCFNGLTAMCFWLECDCNPGN